MKTLIYATPAVKGLITLDSTSFACWVKKPMYNHLLEHATTFVVMNDDAAVSVLKYVWANFALQSIDVYFQ